MKYLPFSGRKYCSSLLVYPAIAHCLTKGLQPERTVKEFLIKQGNVLLFASGASVQCAMLSKLMVLFCLSKRQGNVSEETHVKKDVTMPCQQWKDIKTVFANLKKISH